MRVCRVRRHPGLRDRPPDDAGRQVAVYGLDFRELGHGLLLAPQILNGLLKLSLKIGVVGKG